MVGEEYLTSGNTVPSPLYNEQEKSSFKKIMGVNFVIFLGYFIIAIALLKLGRGDNYGTPFYGLGSYALFFIYLYPLQVIINFIAGIVNKVKKDNERSSAYFLTAFLILIIGFGSCFLAVMGAL